MTTKTRTDPWQWLHDNGFAWDDVNAIAAILAAGGFDIMPVQVEQLADDVRFVGGGGKPSDYWQGFNDGIDKLAVRLREGVLR